MEKFIKCPCCKSNACALNEINDVLFYLCFSCGRGTNSTMTKAVAIKYRANLPELHRELEFIDKKGYYWYPMTITLDDKSMVFAEGTSKDHWVWAAVKSKEVDPKDSEKYKGEKYIADMSTIKRFGKDEYIGALTHIDYFNENNVE